MMLNEVVIQPVVMEPNTTCLMGSVQSNEPNKIVRKCLRLIEKDDFSQFQKLIKSSTFRCRTECAEDIREVLETITKHSSDSKDSDATYISLMWESSKLWRNADLNESIVSHVTQSTNIRTLFSLLMFDWHNSDQCHDEDDDVAYYLLSKFEQYEKATHKSLFSKLYATIDASESNYRHVCLRIIYQLLDEVSKSSDKVKESFFDELNERMKINEVLTMSDTEFKKKILKVFVAYWNESGGKNPLKNEDLIEKLKKIPSSSNPSFFGLAFMLKDKLTSKFEEEFQRYVKQCKRNHGFYYEAKLKADNRLLLHIAEQNNLNQIRSFIFRKCPFNEVNATPLTNLQEISKVLNLNIYPWTLRERALYNEMKAVIETIRKMNRESKTNHFDEQLKQFRRCLTKTNCKSQSYFGNTKIVRNILFEREFAGLSLFEEILRTAGMKEIIELAFDECDTLKNDYVLSTRNPHGKLLINYVIDSKDYMNLIGFIIPNHSNKVSLLTRRHLVKIQNRQHQQITGITLFERFIYIPDKRLRAHFFDVPFCLLEELDEIEDIKTQTNIDDLLLFLGVGELKDQSDGYASNGSNDNMKRAVVQILSPDNENHCEKFELEYDVYKLLRYTLKYWQENDQNFNDYVCKLLSIKDPMAKMILQIIIGQVDEFRRAFYGNVKELFDLYTARYQSKDQNERLIQEDMFVLFRVAIKHGHDEIVEWILDYENFETLPFAFPRHNKATQHNYFAARKLLEYGYELSHDGVPPYWITEQVLRDFLDSQIENYDENLVQINMSCLMNTNDRKLKINDRRDVSDKLLFHEHTGTLQYVMRNEEIKCLLQHPVLSTYINIKTYKFQFIHRLNFFFFIVAFMLPFVFLINIHASGDTNQFSLLQDFFLVVCVLSTATLGFREVLQLVWFYKSRCSYFSDFANQIELLMIVLAWSVILSILTSNVQRHIELFSFISTLLIIVSTVSMMTMLPFSNIPLYMRMLRNVSLTFFKFFSFFVFIVMAFSVSFFVIFKPKRFVGNGQSSSHLTNSTDDDPLLDEDDKNESEVYQNFGTLMGSFFKTLLMLSGEYTIEPFTLSLTKMIIFFIFVITSFIVFNLIIALAITDVNNLTDEAEALDLYHKSEQFIKSSTKWKEFYDKFELETTKLNQLNFVNRWTVKAVRFVLRNHYYVHKLDTVFLNLQTLEVLIKVNKRYESPLSTQFGSNSKFIMSAETFQRVKQILREREETAFRQLQKKMRKP